MLDFLLQWVGNLFVFLGVWYVGEKKRFCFLYSIIGNVLWVWYSCRTHLWSMVFLAGLFTILAVRNWYKWGKE
jgi:nicotinamide riboside transporter PnuC